MSVVSHLLVDSQEDDEGGFQGDMPTHHAGIISLLQTVSTAWIAETGGLLQTMG